MILVFLAIGIKGLCSYIYRSYTLETGIKIFSFTTEEKSDLCSYFDIMSENSIAIDWIEYREGLKNTNVKLQIRVKDRMQLKSVLSNYVVSKDKYSSLGVGIDVSEQFELSEQYLNSNDEHVEVFVFTNKKEILLLFLSDRTNASLKEYIYKQIDADNFEKAY